MQVREPALETVSLHAVSRRNNASLGIGQEVLDVLVFPGVRRGLAAEIDRGHDPTEIRVLSGGALRRHPGQRARALVRHYDVASRIPNFDGRNESLGRRTVVVFGIHPEGLHLYVGSRLRVEREGAGVGALIAQFLARYEAVGIRPTFVGTVAGDAEPQPVTDQRTFKVGMQAIEIAGTQGAGDGTAEFGTGRAVDDVDGASKRVAAEVGALRALQNFHTLGRTDDADRARRTDRHAVDEQLLRGTVVTAGRVVVDVHAGGEPRDVVNRRDAALFDIGSGHG